MGLTRDELYRLNDSSLDIGLLREKYAPPGLGWVFVSNFPLNLANRSGIGVQVYFDRKRLLIEPIKFQIAGIIDSRTMLKLVVHLTTGLSLNGLTETQHGVIHSEQNSLEFALGDKAFNHEDFSEATQTEVGLYARASPQ